MPSSDPNAKRPRAVDGRDTRKVGQSAPKDDFDEGFDALDDEGLDERTTVGPLPTAADGQRASARKAERPATPFASGDDTDNDASVTTNDTPVRASARANSVHRAERQPTAPTQPAGRASTAPRTTDRPSVKAAAQPASSAKAGGARASAASGGKPARAEGWADQAVRARDARRADATRPGDEEPPRSDARRSRDDVRRTSGDETERGRRRRDTRDDEHAEDRSVRRDRRADGEEPTDAESEPWGSDEMLGAPERTVVAPLPQKEASVEPIPEPQRRPKQRKASRSEAQNSRLSAQIDLDEHEPAARMERRKTSVSVENEKLARTPRPADSAWARLRIAIVDVWRVVLLSVKTNWKILRTQGLRPFYERARPHLLRAWAWTQRWSRIVWSKLKTWFFRARIAVEKQATKLGIIKARATYETEAEAKDTADRARAEEWRRFQKGKTSSAYLQDDE